MELQKEIKSKVMEKAMERAGLGNLNVFKLPNTEITIKAKDLEDVLDKAINEGWGEAWKNKNAYATRVKTDRIETECEDKLKERTRATAEDIFTSLDMICRDTGTGCALDLEETLANNCRDPEATANKLRKLKEYYGLMP